MNGIDIRRVMAVKGKPSLLFKYMVLNRVVSESKAVRGRKVEFISFAIKIK